MMSTADVSVVNHGTIFTFHLQTPAAVEWVDQNVNAEDWQYIGDALAVDQRYALYLTQGMLDAGLAVE